MRQIYAIAKAELRTLFFSPIAWLIIIIFSFQAYSAFANSLISLASKQELNGFVPAITGELFTKFNAIFIVIQNNLYLYIPLLTMGLMSREYSSGSIKLLYSSPLGGSKVILGKYLAIALFGIVMMASIVPSIIFSNYQIEELELSLLYSGLLGLMLLFAVYASVGLYMSTLSSYQVVVAMLTLGVLTLLSNMGEIGQNVEGLREITHWLSLKGRTGTFIGGLITSRDLAYFLVIIGIFLSLSVIKINSGRSKEGLLKNLLKYLSVVVVAALLAFLSSRPGYIWYLDATQNKGKTLTERSREIIDQLNGPIKITSYVNMADQQLGMGLAKRRIENRERLDRYKRFMPSLSVEYIYYWDEPYKNSNYKAGVTSAEDVARNFIKPHKIKFESLLTPSQIREKIDLKDELNTFVSVVEDREGKSTFLRVFDDFAKHPSESEISVALLRLNEKVPTVGVVTGYGEPSIVKFGESDYAKFTTERNNRGALINQGFDFKEFNLLESDLQTLENGADILVLADPKRAIEGEALQKILDYIDGGGNILIAAEWGREDNLKAIAQHLGVKFLPGVLVTPNQDFTPTLTSSTIARSAFGLANRFRFLAGEVITMPTAIGLDYNMESPFNITPLTVTPVRGTWNEVENSHFEEVEIRFNRLAGEVQRAIPTSFALTKVVGDKEQRVIFLGDSDCLSNVELGRFRKGIRPQNRSFATALFSWLSYDQFPLNLSRPFPKDNKIFLTTKEAKRWKKSVVWTIPLLLSLITISILYYRKRW
ncbi:MAG: Gldg family protein [Bacteroidales bacterium]